MRGEDRAALQFAQGQACAISWPYILGIDFEQDTGFGSVATQNRAALRAMKF